MEVFILLAIGITLVQCEDSRCAAYKHCQDVNDHKTYQNGDVWSSVNKSEETCAECICMESKEYTVSCVDLEVVNKSLARKKNGIQDTAKGFPKKNDYVVHVEVEQSEESAFKVMCKKGVLPTYNTVTEEIVIRHTHHFFTTRIMYCCKEAPVFSYVSSECKIIFDDLCSPRAVSKTNEDVSCGLVEFA